MNLDQLILIGIQVSIILTVFGYGLQASTDDILFVLRRPLVLARSLLAMFVIMPIVAVAITAIFDFRPAVEISLVALSISPIPPLLPQREVRGGGRSAYALGLMAIAALLSIAFIPVAVYVIGRFVNEPFAISPGAVMRVALLTVLLPLAAGMIFRAVAGPAAARVQKPAALVAIALLGIGVLGIFAAALPEIIALVGNGTILVIVAFVVIGLAVGHALAGPERGDQIVLAVSTAARHPAIALAIARATNPEEEFIVGAILLYLVLNILVSIPYVRWRRS